MVITALFTMAIGALFATKLGNELRKFISKTLSFAPELMEDVFPLVSIMVITLIICPCLCCGAFSSDQILKCCNGFQFTIEESDEDDEDLEMEMHEQMEMHEHMDEGRNDEY